MVVLTVTVNAAVDRTVLVDNFEKGIIHHGKLISSLPGGKGLNVARSLNILGQKVIGTGFVGGKNGEYISEKLKEEGISYDFVNIKSNSRQCTAIIDPVNKIITEVNEDGDEISPQEFEELLNKIENFKPRPDIISFSGSVAPCLPGNTYKQLINVAYKTGVKTLLDAKAIHLEEGIKAKPFAIKPNKSEAEFLLNYSLDSNEKIIKGINFFLDKGIKIVCISLDKKGAVVGTEQNICKIIAPEVETINTVGSGDAFVGGLISGIVQKKSVIESAKMAVATGTANTLCQGAGMLKKSDMDRLLPLVKIEPLFGFCK